jgi:small ligand-binding sensory domain FIST
VPFTAALSEHPDAAVATGEVVGAALEALSGEHPDLALVFVTAPHRDAFGDIVAACSTTLGPAALVGTTAASVVGGDREVEEMPAISLWAARFATGAPAPIPVRLEASSPVTALPESSTLLLVPDPFSFPIDAFLADAREHRPDLTVVGGLASAGQRPGDNLLALDGEVFGDGAVGVLLEPSVVAATFVSQGCRPIGSPMTVTRADRHVLFELAGRPALERLAELLSTLPAEDRELATRGIHLGRVIDEHKLDFERGDFLIRNVLGGDREAGALAVGDLVDVGATVQFQVRDARSADDDLRAVLAGRSGDAALVFTCNGRGTHLFGRPDHDAALVHAAVGGGATAGMFCAGELGPVGGRSFLHGFTASVVLFQDG